MPPLIRVTRSAVIDAPIERVWAILRDFNSHTAWHPVVAESAIENGEPSDQVGCVRNFTLKDGNHIREQLLALSDDDHVSTYCILDATLPMRRYVATVQLKRVTDGNRTFWHWQSTFDVPRGREREFAELGRQGRLRRRLRGPARLPAARAARRAGHRRRGSVAAGAAMPTQGIVAEPLRRPRRARQRRSLRRRRRDRARCASGRPRSASTTSTSTCARASTRCSSRRRCSAWRRPAWSSTSATASPICCPATASPMPARRRAPMSACAPCRRARSWCCPTTSTTRPPPR